MNIYEFIGLVIVALIIGAVLGWLIARIKFSRKRASIERNAIKKILKQDKDYILDGKRYDLKKDVEDQIEGKEPIQMTPYKKETIKHGRKKPIKKVKKRKRK